MSTCGYICPACEGKGFLEDGLPCNWCKTEIVNLEEDYILTPQQAENSLESII